MQKDIFDQINKLLNESQDITIACGQNFDSDTIAAALSLYLVLTKLSKNVEIVASKPTTVEFAKYVGIDKVGSELSSRKFLITLKNVLGTVDKVTHYLEGDELNIVVHPIPGAPKFTQDSVSFKYSQPATQLIFLIGVNNLDDLGKLYLQEQEMFAKTPLIAINKGETSYNSTSLSMGKNRLTVSESIVELVSRIKLPIDIDVASNLYSGIADATNNFQDKNLTAECLEAAAFCLRIKGQTTLPGFDVQTIADKQLTTDQSQTEQTEEPKDDWLTPKIYKSSNPVQ